MTKKDEAKTSVWWDIDRYPVPGDCDAHQIAPSIKRALRSLGYYGPLTITAIGKLTDVRHADLQALYSTGIAFKIVASRAVSILGDMSEWTETNPPPANIMLISDNEVLWPSLGGMRLNKGYNILYAYLPECMQDLNFPAECLWPNILADARETRRNELQEQCSETGEPAWLCKACEHSGDQSFGNFLTHLNSEEHSQTMLDR
ncbi:unnamed protein product [Arabidopsis halleri]